MKKIAQFEKVSFEQFKEAIMKCKAAMSEEEMKFCYDNIELPTRSTSGSAGYDFKMPFSVFIDKTPTMFPTGIRCKMEPGWVLILAPRSSLGTKFGTTMSNTIGVIDSDYYNAENEGHIHCQMFSSRPFVLGQGEKFMQGIFLPFGVTVDDSVTEERKGGFGSTGK